jgi:Raf kinase inhibitor-like YbhB/YbcL family protein
MVGGGPHQEKTMSPITLSSTAFHEGQAIPARYTADGEDVSPPLSWTGVPGSTQSLALVCEDPDAPRGIWTHWVLFNLLPSAEALEEDVPPQATLPDGSVQGTNDFKRLGYGGPSPPPGKPHRYYFKLFALDTTLPLSPGASRQQVLDAMKGHVLGQAQLMGTYGRSRR